MDPAKVEECILSKKCIINDITEYKIENLTLEKLDFHCDQCGLEFQDITNLFQHIKQHLKYSPISFLKPKSKFNFCPFCVCRFDGQYDKGISDLGIHKTEISLLSFIECRFCLARPKNFNDLLEHYKDIHKNPTPFFDFFLNSSTSLPGIKFYTGKKKHPFQCDICLRSFARRYYLKQHRSMHSGKKPYECEHCDKNFSNPRNLTNHMKVHTRSDSKPYQCNMCPKRFSRTQSLVYHRYVHAGEKPYACKFCSKKFSAPEYLKRHLNIHNESSDNPYKCNRCGKIFESSYNLKRHIKRIHVNPGPQSYACDNCDRTFKKKVYLVRHLKGSAHNDIKRLKCDYCEKTFAFKNLLDDHMIFHKNENIEMPTCMYCSKKFNKPGYLRRHIVMNHKCEFCPKIYQNKTALNAHRREHAGPGPHTCSYCDIKLANASEFLNHIKLHTYKCDLCTETFSKEFDLNLHRYEHSGEKMHACKLCSSRFMHSNRLRSHLKDVHGDIEGSLCLWYDNPVQNQDLPQPDDIQTEPEYLTLPNETGYFCKVCSKKFEDLKDLRLHIIEVHIKNEEKIYSCRYCDQSFKKMFDLNKHKRELHSEIVEKPHKCDMCSKEFYKKQTLIYHRYNHTGERPFPCDQCEKNFTRPSILQKHKEQVHTPPSLRSHRCHLCPKSFVYKYILDKHIRVHKLRDENGGVLKRKKDKSIDKEEK